MWSPATIRRPARNCGAPNGLNPDNDGSYRIVASPVVFGELIVAPSRERPMLALKAGGRGDVTKSHVLWSFGNGPDVPTPVTDGTYLYVVNDRGIMFCLDAKTRQGASTVVSACARAPTAGRRCSPTARSTSPTRMA